MESREDRTQPAFSAGENVICGASGVYRIEKIANLHMEYVPEDREYYILQPQKDRDSRVYIPVDRAEGRIRKALSAQEVRALIGRMPEIPPLTAVNEKMTEELYRRCLSSFDRIEWIRMIKFIYERKQERLSRGKKTTLADEKTMRAAEEALYSEFAMALDIPREEVVPFICDYIQNMSGASPQASVVSNKKELCENEP